MPQQSEERTLFVGARAATIAGVAVGAVVIGSQLLLGRIYSGQQASDLLAGAESPVTALATSSISALGTILALMLTMLSLSRRFGQDLHRAFYRRIQSIALLSIIGMVVGIMLLLFLTSPAHSVGRRVVALNGTEVGIIYYLVVAITALLAGLLVTTIVMLYNAVQTVITVLTPDD